jgi:Skp family chaperone for outer membrane proteins
MQNKIRWILSLAVLLLASVTQAQSSEDQLAGINADSLQRHLMKDSLQVSDAQVDAFFGARDSLFARISAIRKSAALDITAQDSQVLQLRNAANKEMETILGREAFLNYVRLVRRRLNQRNMGNEQPLSGVAEN